jgi:hypothetical protein
MARENQLSRYGAISKDIQGDIQSKALFVSPSGSAFLGDLLNTFPNDDDGVSRVFTTLTAALAAAVDSRGDVIYILPGYTETITAAAGQAITKAGVRIIGLGKGTLRPTFTFTTSTAASFDITAAGVTIENCIFTNAINSQTAMFNVTADGFTFLNNQVNTNSGTTGAVLGILTAATASNMTIEGNKFVGPATNSGATTTAQIKHEVGVDYVIRNNYFTGKMTQAILNATTVLRGLIDNNRFVVATGTVAITMAAASTPFISNNRINVPSGTAPIVAAAGFMSGNNYSAAAGVTAGTASTF